ncbi:hypothetical protein DMB66_40265 [Actinoplanes sp. ATCC 53533]|uniref:hypothetical protein n=1 Tax=Actinoplanes sp. ATCC 53533 TaxID=1288362 RepID=UPI000F79B1AE|nr:hypothetical protein [Actinoplanes sp. ATCC 53533]RSM52335.1 hypothetical protein DMB66_40265 [Actinoplanes sp. ATCC 53533]
MGSAEQVRHRVDELRQLPGVKQLAGTPVLHCDTELPGLKGRCDRRGESVVEPDEHARRHSGQHGASAHRIVPLVAGDSGHLNRVDRGHVQ